MEYINDSHTMWPVVEGHIMNMWKPIQKVLKFFKTISDKLA
jgi:hypothetical protein